MQYFLLQACVPRNISDADEISQLSSTHKALFQSQSNEYGVAGRYERSDRSVAHDVLVSGVDVDHLLTGRQNIPTIS